MKKELELFKLKIVEYINKNRIDTLLDTINEGFVVIKIEEGKFVNFILDYSI